MKVSGVLFDLDSTLTDRAGSLELVSDQLISHYGKNLDCHSEKLCACLKRFDDGGHRTKGDFFANVVDNPIWNRAPSAVEFAEVWRAVFPSCAVLIDDARPVLEALRDRGVRLGIVTNGTARSQNEKLDVLGIRPLMSTVVVSETIGSSKPEVKIFQHALREIGLDARDVLFVGDHPEKDVLGAMAVGMRAVWVRGDHPWPEGAKQPEHAIGRLGELLTIISE
jgi:putative hydrolase of the HAD superfamily